MNFIGKRRLWFTISLVAIVPGLVSLIIWGLKPGIDFTGGEELRIQGNTNIDQTKAIVASLPVKNITVTTSGANGLLIRYQDQNSSDAEKNHQAIKTSLASVQASEESFNSIGPAISHDITKHALVSVILASLAIVIYIAFAFRNAPPPVSPWSFGVTAIIAMLHDAFLVLGVFSILGHFFNIEIDSLFVTAILTVIGFSVHDTIVVFDRIRENLRRYDKAFEVIVNDSILETLARSINTSMTVLMTLLALFLFGGDSIKHFVLALLIGIFSGTYSSIFNASPLLVVYNNWKLKRANSPRKLAKA